MTSPPTWAAAVARRARMQDAACSAALSKQRDRAWGTSPTAGKAIQLLERVSGGHARFVCHDHDHCFGCLLTTPRRMETAGCRRRKSRIRSQNSVVVMIMNLQHLVGVYSMPHACSSVLPFLQRGLHPPLHQDRRLRTMYSRRIASKPASTLLAKLADPDLCGTVTSTVMLQPCVPCLDFFLSMLE